MIDASQIDSTAFEFPDFESSDAGRQSCGDGIGMRRAPMDCRWGATPSAREHQIGVLLDSRQSIALCQSVHPQTLPENCGTMIWQDVHMQTIQEQTVVMGLGHRHQDLSSCCAQFKSSPSPRSNTESDQYADASDSFSLQFEYAWRLTKPREALVLIYQLNHHLKPAPASRGTSDHELLIDFQLPKPLSHSGTHASSPNEPSGALPDCPVPSATRTTLAVSSSSVSSQDNSSVGGNSLSLELVTQPPLGLNSADKQAFDRSWLVIKAAVPPPRKLPQTLLWTLDFRLL